MLILAAGFSAVEDTVYEHRTVHVIQFQNDPPVANPETIFLAPSSEPDQVTLTDISEAFNRIIYSLSHRTLQASNVP